MEMSPPLEKVRELPFRAPSEKEVASVPNSILPGLAPAERVTSPDIATSKRAASLNPGTALGLQFPLE